MAWSTRKCPHCDRDIDTRGFAVHLRHCERKAAATPSLAVAPEAPVRKKKMTGSHAMGKFGGWISAKGSEWVAMHTLEEIQSLFNKETGLEVGTSAAKVFIAGEGWKCKRKLTARYTSENTVQVLALALASLYRQLGEQMPPLFVDILQGRPVDIDALNRLHESVVANDFVDRVIPIAAMG